VQHAAVNAAEETFYVCATNTNNCAAVICNNCKQSILFILPNFLSVFYRSYKNIVNSVFIFLGLVVFSVICYSLSPDFINCDAPRA